MIKITDDRAKVVVVDPFKLNRGQVVHFEGGVSDLSLSDSNTYTASKSYKTIVEKKECCNVVFCDWFETTLVRKLDQNYDVESEFIEIADGLILEALPGRSKNYQRLWNVVYFGEHFGVLQTCPSATFIHALYIQFRIKNDHLYRSDWLTAYREILELSGWTHKSLTRLDIAIDGKAGDNAKIITKRHLSGRTIGRKGKALLSTSYTSNKTIIRYHVGSPSSEKSATIYNKVDDNKKTGKTYISEAWKINGLKDIEKTDRFEIRMRSKIANNYDWTRLDDSSYLSSVVRTECKNWFEFYYKGRDKNKYRSHKSGKMEWIDWSDIAGQLLPKNKAVAKSGVHRAKRIIKDCMYLNYVEGKDVPSGLIRQLKKEYTLHKWFDTKVPYWHQEWSREKRYKNLNSN